MQLSTGFSAKINDAGITPLSKCQLSLELFEGYFCRHVRREKPFVQNDTEDTTVLIDAVLPLQMAFHPRATLGPTLVALQH